MTAEEVYQSVTNGGTSDFAAAVQIFEGFGPWCLIDDLAVNSYVEPVYTVDADFVIVSDNLSRVSGALDAAGFSLQTFAHSLNARRPESQLSLQLTTDPRYQDFPERAERKKVLGVMVPVASLEDIILGKVWACEDRDRRLTKRKKDELDLLRLAEAYPHLASSMPMEIVRQMEDGQA